MVEACIRHAYVGLDIYGNKNLLIISVFYETIKCIAD